MKNPLVSVIILTYANGLPHVRKCLESFKNVRFDSYEIILVDNASTDNTVLYIRKHFPKVVLIESKKNLGFCEGNNVGLKKAKGKYILFLNNDVEVTPGFLEPLVSLMEKDETMGVVQPKIRQLIEKEKLDACASFLTNTGFLYHYGYSQKQSDKKYNKRLFLYSAKGACFLTRRSIIEKIGLFDKDYFAYFEETDFCHRVWLAGFTVMYTPASEIFHLGGADKKNDHPATLQFDAYKNRICTYIKNLSAQELIKILPVHLMVCLGVAVAYLLLNRYRISQGILKAIVWNITHSKKTLQKRRDIQKNIRRVSDKSFMNKIKINPPVSYYKHFLLDPRGKYNDI